MDELTQATLVAGVLAASSALLLLALIALRLHADGALVPHLLGARAHLRRNHA